MTVAYLLALAASAFWGLADFFGGRESRRLPALWVVFASQAVAFGLLCLLVAGLAVTGNVPDALGWLPWGAAAGVSGAVALVAFYRGLATGRMGVVAPIAATGAVVPVVVGLARGDEPHTLQVVGIAVAIVGVVLASRPEVEAAAHGALRPVLLAVAAGLGFGLVLVFLDLGSRTDVAFTLWAQRGVAVTGLLALAWRVRPTAGASALWPLAVIGVSDIAANAAFAFASTTDAALSVVAVLASLYPIVTGLLAWQLLHERLTRTQWFGVAAALAGTLLIVGASG